MYHARSLPSDPRWGRFQEVPSEDPLVLSEYAVEYTTGAQQGEDTRFLQVCTALQRFLLVGLDFQSLIDLRPSQR